MFWHLKNIEVKTGTQLLCISEIGREDADQLLLEMILHDLACMKDREDNLYNTKLDWKDHL